MSELAKGHAWKACKPERARGFESRSLRHLKLSIKFVALNGEVAVPCNLQSAVAGLKLSRGLMTVVSASSKWC